MENDDQKGRSSDELTPNEPERKDDDEGDNERKIGSKSSARIKPASDALDDIYFEDGIKVSAKPESDKNPAVEKGEKSGCKTYNA